MVKVKWRVLFAVLGAMGMAIIYGLKVNLSVAIVAMVNQTAIKAMSSSHHQGGGSEEEVHLDNTTGALICTPDGPSEGAEGGPATSDTGGGNLVWTQPEQGLVLGSYFWGYLVTQVGNRRGVCHPNISVI